MRWVSSCVYLKLKSTVKDHLVQNQGCLHLVCTICPELHSLSKLHVTAICHPQGQNQPIRLRIDNHDHVSLILESIIDSISCSSKLSAVSTGPRWGWSQFGNRSGSFGMCCLSSHDRWDKWNCDHSCWVFNLTFEDELQWPCMGHPIAGRTWQPICHPFFCILDAYENLKASHGHLCYNQSHDHN